MSELRKALEWLRDNYAVASFKEVDAHIEAALALPDAGGVPEGWKLVPIEPTEAMLNAARDWSVAKYGKGVGNDGAIGCYGTMLAASPAPPERNPKAEG